MISNLGFRSQTLANRVIKGNVEKISNTQTLPANTVLVDGGSYVARGVNGQLLEDELNRLGFPSKVIQKLDLNILKLNYIK